MLKNISKTEEFKEKMILEGIVRKYFPSTPEDYENMYKFNEQMEKIRRDSLIKSYNSEIDASNCIFTC